MAVVDDNTFQPDRTRSNENDAALWKRFRGAPGEDARLSTLSRLKLSDKSPKQISHFLPNLLPADARRSDALMRDVWRIGMERVSLATGHSPFATVLPSRHFADRMHRFAWIADLMNAGEEGRNRACKFVDDWISRYGQFDGFAWRLDATATRVWNWLRVGETLFGSTADPASRTRIDSLARQVNYLKDTVDGASDPRARWMGACVLLSASICLDNGDGLHEALDRLETECNAQILPDGGHVSRSPSRTLSTLMHLQALEMLIKSAGYTVPDYFSKWIPRMGAMVAFFRVGDGALDPFNDGDESRKEVVAAAIERLPGLPRRFTFAPKSGFQKLERGALRLMLDCGEAPPRPFGDFAHAGALSFELSDGPARLITSCGFSPEVNVHWQAAVRRTGAHSTLVLNGRDSSQFSTNDETRLLCASGPEGISAKRLEEGDEIWLDAQHSGYKQSFGLLHRRRLFMNGAGTRLTGEDSLARPVSATSSESRYFPNFEIRFHLHPTVTATMGRDAIRLICDNGSVWKFKTSHENARLERTVYLARGIVEQPEQIVLAGKADPNGDGMEPPNCVRWAFLRESQL